MSIKTPIAPISDGGLNDNLLHLGRNGNVPIGGVERVIAAQVQYRQHQGRPVGHFWGGWDSFAAITGASAFRIGRLDMLDGGCANFGAVMHVIPRGIDLSTTAGIYIDSDYTALADHGNNAVYPEQLRTKVAMTAETSPAVAAGATSEKIIGFDSVYPMAGCWFEDSVPAFEDADTTVLTGGFGPARDILAVQTGSYGTVDRLVDRFMHVWRNRRTVYSWFTTEDSYAEFAVSSQAYRYLFDQSIGTGGTAPSNTGPAVTLPCANAAAGLEETVRVYVWVYAAMSGSTDGGTLAVANKDTSGVMGSMTPLVNGPTIGGTGYAWYPSLGSFDPATAAYFESPTNQAFDRMLLGARSEGATDKVRIRGVMMAVFPSRA